MKSFQKKSWIEGSQTQKSRILGYAAMASGSALLLMALYEMVFLMILYYTTSNEDLSSPFFYLALPLMFSGICVLVIGVGALSDSYKKKTKQSRQKTRRMAHREGFPKEIKEKQPITQEVPRIAVFQQVQPQAMAKTEEPPQQVQLDKRARSLLNSIWIIALGIIFWISGYVISGNGTVNQPSSLFPYLPTTEYTWVYYLGVGIMWSGIIALVVGIFLMITTIIKGYLTSEHKPIPPPPANPS